MKNSLRQQAYGEIRRRIASGQLPIGARLSPAELARDIGVSHIPVREALSRLQSDGMVEWRPNIGSFVASPDLRDVIELFELREMIESAAAAAAARRATDEQIAELGRTIGAMRAAAALVRRRKLKAFDRETMVAFVAADLTFHRQILRIAGNRRAMKVLGDGQVVGRLHFVRLVPPAMAFPDMLAVSFECHREMFEAIKARNAALARRLMARHVRKARADAVKVLEAGPASAPLHFVPEIWRVIESLNAGDTRLFAPSSASSPIAPHAQRRIG